MSDIWNDVREYGPEATANSMIDSNEVHLANRANVREWCHWMYLCQKLEDRGIEINTDMELHQALMGWSSALREVTLKEFNIE